MATADKLDKILTTKEAIRQALITQGQTVSTSDKFSLYPSKILAIESGGSGGDSDKLQWASGTDTGKYTDFTITNLSFRPSLVIVTSYHIYDDGYEGGNGTSTYIHFDNPYFYNADNQLKKSIWGEDRTYYGGTVNKFEGSLTDTSITINNDGFKVNSIYADKLKWIAYE